MNNIFSFIQSILIVITTTLSAPVTKLPVLSPIQTPLVIINQATPSALVKPTSIPQASQTTSGESKNAEKIVSVEEKPDLVAVGMVRATDVFEFSNQKAAYYIDIPKNGGRISGKMSGLCNGEISGEFNGQTVDFAKTSDRKDITGEISGTCKVGFIPLPASAKFYGEVSFTSNRVSLTVDVEKPFQSRYYPTLRIQ